MYDLHFIHTIVILSLFMRSGLGLLLLQAILFKIFEACGKRFCTSNHLGDSGIKLGKKEENESMRSLHKYDNIRLKKCDFIQFVM